MPRGHSRLLYLEHFLLIGTDHPLFLMITTGCFTRAASAVYNLAAGDAIIVIWGAGIMRDNVVCIPRGCPR